MTQTDAPASHAFFSQEAADAYDRRNSPLAPISGGLHFLLRLVLADLPDDARVLCVGVGTGAEILSLAAAYPGWSFVGIDPSEEMLAVGRRRLEAAGVLSRCQLFRGYVHEAPIGPFDAAVSLLVAHFIKRADRPAFYSAIHDRLKPGGRLATAEISGDLDAAEFPQALEDWKRVQVLMGATPESLARLEDMMRGVLGVLTPTETEDLWKAAGFPRPVPFFQAFMIRGWHAVKA
ncbi:class I SAM-dependent methyltransferase [Phenylobacterium sp. J426]|uniref:class I SAM-dependent methyltransferase n=1 Tax=Phenylobacterium sp. J426 TaxID=2898439 RepID=UPI002150F573|nr:class I SAM-dependent methyltransferase [Phenylobacterium sp. J426]MCR5872721.1 class I SAM-dependent methyltransferase [Phenylobacterium sp. J426]